MLGLSIDEWDTSPLKKKERETNVLGLSMDEWGTSPLKKRKEKRPFLFFKSLRII